jgi:hypothetical protein
MQFRIEKRIAAPGLLGLALLGYPGLFSACRGVTEPPDPPGGGQTYFLGYPQFEATVAPVLSRQGCDADGDCHGGGIRGTLELSPPGDKDLAFDFAQVSLQVNGHDPEASPILTKPLAEAAGGTPHGSKPFADASDPDYQALLTWIKNGSFQ